MNRAIFTGRLTDDPKTGSTQSGIQWASFDMAVDRYKKEDGTQVADFFTVKAWRGLADICGRFLKKGSKVLVAGSLENEKFTDRDGVKRTKTVLVAANMEFMGGRKEENAAPAQAPENSGFVQVDEDELPF